VTGVYDLGFDFRLAQETSPKFPDWIWNPLSILFSGYQGPFMGGRGARAWIWSLVIM